MWNFFGRSECDSVGTGMRIHKIADGTKMDFMQMQCIYCDSFIDIPSVGFYWYLEKN